MRTYVKTELAWAAGFFDGEGNVGCTKNNVIRLKVSQIDRQVLDRFKATIGFGIIYLEPRTTVAGNPVWTYRVTSFAGVQQICADLWSWLSPVKRKQFKQALLQARSIRKKWQRCAAIGHTIKNVNNKPKQFYCYTCRKEQWAKYRNQKKVSV